MLSFRYVLLWNSSVSVFLSVQVSGWSFSSGIVSKSGAFHWTKNFRVDFPKTFSNIICIIRNFRKERRSRDTLICFSSQIFQNFRLIASRFLKFANFRNFQQLCPEIVVPFIPVSKVQEYQVEWKTLFFCQDHSFIISTVIRFYLVQSTKHFTTILIVYF